MSCLLKEYLCKVAEEDFEKEREKTMKHVNETLSKFKTLILTIRKAQRYDLVILAEGSPPEGVAETEKEFNMLERANLVKSELKFTSRDTYRRYVLTKKGDDLAERLIQE